MDNRTENEDWLKTLQRKLNDFEEPVGEAAWQKIEQRLSSVPRPRSINRRRYYYAIAAAIAALIGLTLFFGLIYSPVAEKMPSNIASIQNRQVSPNLSKNPTSAIAQVVENDESQSTNSPLSAINRPIRTKQETSRSEIMATNISAIPQTSSQDNFSQDNGSQVQSRNAKVKEEKTTANEEKSQEYKKKRTLPIMVKAGSVQTKDSPRWSVGVSVGGNSTIQSENTLDNNVVSNDVASSDYRFDISPTSYLKAVPQGYSNYSFNHHIPISFGLNVRKMIDNKFSVESGVVFTMLVSDISNSSKKQRLYYVGIPIKGNWTYYKVKEIELYLTAGAMGEKCIYARLGNEKLKVNQIQFSINGGAGIGIDLSKRLQLFGEAGFSYYFKDGSFVETIRKDKPFRINLQAGLRFSY